MQITRQTDYAVRCILHLTESTETVVMVSDIAAARNIPRSFLAKILQKLVKAKIVRSYRGVKGGFKLAKKPEDISLLDIIVAVEGPMAMNICAINKKYCSLSNTCTVHPVWIEVREAVESSLKKISFKKLANSNI